MCAWAILKLTNQISGWTKHWQPTLRHPHNKDEAINRLVENIGWRKCNYKTDQSDFSVDVEIGNSPSSHGGKHTGGKHTSGKHWIAHGRHEG